jgi:phenylpyruvate tautomerase PptA (4-oxalocrotonate tautomerase family)
MPIIQVQVIEGRTDEQLSKLIESLRMQLLKV